MDLIGLVFLPKTQSTYESPSYLLCIPLVNFKKRKKCANYDIIDMMFSSATARVFHLGNLNRDTLVAHIYTLILW